MRRLAGLLLLATLPTFAAGGPRAAAAEDGIGLGTARHVRVTGTVLDANTGLPLPEAQVTIAGANGNRYGDAGPDGSFVVTADSDAGLGDVSIIFSHSAYQQKYLETVLRDTFRGRVEAKIAAGRALVKAKKLALDLACDGRAEIGTKGPDAAPFRVVCDGGLTGVEFEVRHNRIAVLAAAPFTLRVEDGRLEVRDTQADTVELRVVAVMLPR